MARTWFPRRLTSAQREERRLRAAAWFGTGRRSHAEIARRLGVSEAAVSKWYAQWRRRGTAALRARPRPGRPSALTEPQWRTLLGRLHRGAQAAGFETEAWTLKRIACVIERWFGVHYHPRSLARALHARQWSAHRPTPRARERDDALVEAWLKQDWPRIKKELTARGARLPSWTRRVTRFGPASCGPGRR